MATIYRATPAEPAEVSRAARQHAKKKQRIGSSAPAHRQDSRLAWLLITPAIVGFVFFAAYPLVRGVYLSFTSFHVLSPPRWTGLDNVKELWHDDVFWSSVRTTVYFVGLSVAIGVLLSLATAVILHRLTKSTVIRGLIILPFLISGVVAGLVWSWMLDTQLGIVNNVIEKLTGHKIGRAHV